MKKYEFTGETKVIAGVTLKRIRALISFGFVVKGEIGGFIESEKNLSHDGNAWVADNARVAGNAWVAGNARVTGNAMVTGNAWVAGNARVTGNAWVTGNARVTDNAMVTGNADYMLIGGIGSRNDFTTFYKDIDGGISVRCGCFYGTIEEFREKVEETHGTDTKHAKVYQAAANLAEMQILEQEAE